MRLVDLLSGVRKNTRQYCTECKKDRLHVEGQCVVCTDKVNRTMEAVRTDTAFAHLDPEE
jgi:hypothetical protein